MSRGQRRRLYADYSDDGGRRFGPPFRLSVPNAPSSVAAMRLADGRLAVIGNPQDAGVNRDPLHLALFEPRTGELARLYAIRQGLDGAPRHDGWHKHGAAAYPGVDHDEGGLYVSYSIAKETIAVTRIPISAI